MIISKKAMRKFDADKLAKMIKERKVANIIKKDASLRQSSFYYWTRGEKVPNTKNLVKISNALEVDPSIFFIKTD